MSETEFYEDARTFLLVVDRSAEMKAALRYACRRAARTGGGIALFHVVPQTEFHHFKTIGELMDHEARTEAERRLQEVAGEVHRQIGKFPELYFRQGDALTELTKVIAETPSISVLVLGAGTGTEGPGPIVSALSGKLAGKINIPVTIVPGDLTLEQIDAIS
ncbi:MAG: universal stress protein [Rhodospirillaceae bacterium]|nr:universal stress protein [Rhodospirillaceae bacterium]